MSKKESDKKGKKQPGKTLLEKRLEELAAAAEKETAEGSEPFANDAMDEVNAEALVAERDELQGQLLRARAEFENSRKRMERETERIRKVAAEALIQDLLPVLDHLDLALQHAEDPSSGFAQGVEMVLKQFSEALGRHGVRRIPAEGERFDPAVHEAVMQRPSNEVDADFVLEEFQKGYMLGDTILRPAKVVVSSGPLLSAADVEEEVEAGAIEDTSVPVNIEISEETESDEDTTLVDL